MPEFAADAALARWLIAAFGQDAEDDVQVSCLLADCATPEALLDRLMGTSGFERRYKLLRTNKISRSGIRENDPLYVALPNYHRSNSFRPLFDQYFRPRLAQRAEGFGRLFDRLQEEFPSGGLIVETGALRIPGNWDGDGQSTFMFDEFVRAKAGTVLSIDSEPLSIDSARTACSSRTTLVLNDSVAALLQLHRLGLARRIDLLYLDSFDVDESNPLPSAIHHMKELAAAWPMLRSGSIVCIDDYALGGAGGKGLIVDDFMRNASAEILFEGYQKIWVVR